MCSNNNEMAAGPIPVEIKRHPHRQVSIAGPIFHVHPLRILLRHLRADKMKQRDW